MFEKIKNKQKDNAMLLDNKQVLSLVYVPYDYQENEVVKAALDQAACPRVSLRRFAKDNIKSIVQGVSTAVQKFDNYLEFISNATGVVIKGSIVKDKDDKDALRLETGSSKPHDFAL